KKFGSNDFRSALENGILFCEKVNRLPTPIAGLDNLNVFLKACGKLGLKEAQLFHPGDLQDLSTRVTVKHQETNRRLKNVLITIYWLGRRAQCDRFYDGPYLNFKAFEGLLGTALYKALQETSSQKGSNVRDSGFGDSWCSEREELHHLRVEGGGGHKRDDSLDSLDSLGSQTHSISSDTTLKGSSEECCSDTEADSLFRMADNRDTVTYRRSISITPKSGTSFNQFLPTKDKASGYVPAPLRRKRAEHSEDNRRSWTSFQAEDEGTLTRYDRSKSTSDIQVDPSALRRIRFEELQKIHNQIKESDDKWQDDLSKWKSRRKSVNSDIVKKKEERERIEQITSSSSISSSSSSNNRRSKTFKEMQEERAASPPTSRSFDVVDGPAGSDPTTTYTSASHSSVQRSQSPPGAAFRSRPVSEHTSTVKTEASKSIASSSSSLSSMETKPPAVSRVSTSLPRSNQRLDSTRLTSVVAPRPFGTQSTRISFTLIHFIRSAWYYGVHDVLSYDPQKRVNGKLDASKKSAVLRSYQQFMTPEEESSSQSSSAHSSEDEEEQLVFGVQESHCEMRISLNQKPNSSKDFGFQAAWDSTGARVSSVQPGSQAEMCQLQAGDEVLTVNRHKVAEMSYMDWKSCMEEALQEGSLVMDICRHGKSSESSACSVCVCVTLGELHSWTDKSESISLKNLKRRSEFFEKGKKNNEKKIPVPSIMPSVSRWSWDPEEERKRQEKWQKEQERLLQEQEHQRQAEEWRKKEQAERELQRLREERKRREEEERQRQAEERREKEEEEREWELQRLQEERKKLEEEELRWQKRREEEREEERRQQEAAEQLRREREQQQWSVETLLPSPELPSHFPRTSPSSVYRADHNTFYQLYSDEKVGQQSLSQAEAERQQILNEMKKKTPLLTDSSWIRQRTTGTTNTVGTDLPLIGESLDNLDARNSWRSSWTPRSNSSIPNYYSRPHSALSGSTSFYGGGPAFQQPNYSALSSSYSMGSLRDRAGTPSSLWSQQSHSPSPSSLSPTSPVPTSDPGNLQLRNRSVSGRKICTFCDCPLGKGAAMIIESLGLCYHLSCFKCVDCKSDLGGSEAGAEVRIRNKQLYCNFCYMQFKTGQPTTM
uniref:Uncharacterized protein n=1 Tax=Mola mola TaxID=94237 RepID=A0A3Q4BVR9_MOLML